MANYVKPFVLSDTRKRRTPKRKVPKPENLTHYVPRGSVEGVKIQGKSVGSVDELWTSWALDRLLEENVITGYDYQISVFGGRSRPGGNVVDFLVHTPMTTYLLDPMGRVWHSGAKEDRFQMERVAHRKGWKLVAWYTDQTPDPDAVYALLKLKIR